MGKTKRNILRLGNSLVTALISLLGFTTACNQDDMMLMYGTPVANADFLITGTVSSEATNEPIQNIKVKTIFDSTYTDSKGKYAVLFYGSTDTDSVAVQYIDEDGKTNGEFFQLDKNVSFVDPQFSGGNGGSNQGVAIKEVDVELTEKK